jgi:hypothetical protein
MQRCAADTGEKIGPGGKVPASEDRRFVEISPERSQNGVVVMFSTPVVDNCTESCVDSNVTLNLLETRALLPFLTTMLRVHLN